MPQVGSFPIRGIVIGFELLTFLLRASVHFLGCWQVLAHPLFWCGTVCLWEVLLRLSINFLLFWGFLLGCSSYKVSKDHREYRLASQLSASPFCSLLQKLSAASLLAPNFSSALRKERIFLDLYLQRS